MERVLRSACSVFGQTATGLGAALFVLWCLFLLFRIRIRNPGIRFTALPLLVVSFSMLLGLERPAGLPEGAMAGGVFGDWIYWSLKGSALHGLSLFLAWIAFPASLFLATDWLFVDYFAAAMGLRFEEAPPPPVPAAASPTTPPPFPEVRPLGSTAVRPVRAAPDAAPSASAARPGVRPAPLSPRGNEAVPAEEEGPAASPPAAEPAPDLEGDGPPTASETPPPPAPPVEEAGAGAPAAPEAEREGADTAGDEGGQAGLSPPPAERGEAPAAGGRARGPEGSRAEDAPATEEPRAGGERDATPPPVPSAPEGAGLRPLSPETAAGAGGERRNAPPSAEDLPLEEAERVVLTEGRASLRLLQERLHVGCFLAARIMDRLEKAGVVTPPDGEGRRRVLGAGGGAERGKRGDLSAGQGG